MKSGLPVSSWLLLGPHRRRRRLFTQDQIAAERHRAREWSIPCEGGGLKGLLWPAGVDRPFLLHFYGAGMSVDMEIGRCSWLHQHYDLNVAAFDYRGYGRTGGAWQPQKQISDALAAYDHLRLLAGVNPIHVHGFSMGAVLAAHVASARPVASAILLAPPAGLQDCQQDAFDRFPVFQWIHRYWPFRFEPALKILLDARTPMMDQTVPLLILHGDLDRTVRLHQGEKVYWASAAAIKRLIPATGHTHCSLPWQGDIYEAALTRWFFDLEVPIPLANRTQTGKIPSCSKGILEVNARNPLHD
jgi:uncharacterized protein